MTGTKGMESLPWEVGAETETREEDERRGYRRVLKSLVVVGEMV